MAVININNSRSIDTFVRDVQLRSEAGLGSVYWTATDGQTENFINRVSAQILMLGFKDGTVREARAAVSDILSLLNGMHARSLYSIQSMLNDSCWESLRISIEVSLDVEGYTNEFGNSPSMQLKSIWHDANNN